MENRDGGRNERNPKLFDEETYGLLEFSIMHSKLLFRAISSLAIPALLSLTALVQADTYLSMAPGDGDNYAYYLANGHTGGSAYSPDDYGPGSPDLLSNFHQYVGTKVDYGTRTSSVGIGILSTKAWINGMVDAVANGWTYNNDPRGRLLAFASYAAFSDNLSFDGIGTGSFRLVIDQHGDYTTSGQGTAYGELAVSSGTRNLLSVTQFGSGSDEYLTDPIPFQAGQAVSIKVGSYSRALLWSGTGTTLTGSALADASHTTTIRGIEVFDARGNLVSNVSATGTSGFVYQPVPEPTTLTALSLGALALLRRRSDRLARRE